MIKIAHIPMQNKRKTKSGFFCFSYSEKCWRAPWSSLVPGLILSFLSAVFPWQGSTDKLFSSLSRKERCACTSILGFNMNHVIDHIQNQNWSNSGNRRGPHSVPLFTNHILSLPQFFFHWLISLSILFLILFYHVSVSTTTLNIFKNTMGCKYTKSRQKTATEREKK